MFRGRGLEARWLRPLLPVLALLLVLPLGLGTPAAARPASEGFTLAAQPTFGPAPLLVHFQATLPNGSSPELSWEFGDGQSWNATGAASLAPAHEYLRPGNFTAVVTATWSTGSLVASIGITVYAANLSVQILADPLNGAAPLTVQFDGLPSGGTGTYVAYRWEFGDGTSAMGPSPAHTFARPGDFQVNLTVNDSVGSVAAASVQIAVTSSGTPPGGGSGPGGGSPSGSSGGGGSALDSWVLPAVVGLLGAGGGALAVAAAWRSSARRRYRAPSAPAPSTTPTPGGDTPAPAVALVQVATGLGLPDLLPAPVPAGPPSPALPAPPSSGPRGGEDAKMMAPPERAPVPPDLMGGRQLTQRILRHLATLPRLGPADVPTLEWTQAGMAERLNVGLSAVSKILRRLEAAGIVASETGHAIGSSRRVRIYRLTPRGERLGQALREATAPSRAPADLYR